MKGSVAACVGVAALMLAVAVPAAARDKNGFYLGGSIGQSELKVEGGDPDIGDIEFKEGDTGYQLVVGYRFWTWFALEGGYVDFGNPDTTFETGLGDLFTEIELTGWDASAVGNLPLGIVDLFAKVGYFWWDADIRAALGDQSDVDSDSGSDLTYGIGVAVWLGQIAIRGEVEWFDVADADNVWMYSVGVSYTFGRD